MLTFLPCAQPWKGRDKGSLVLLGAKVSEDYHEKPLAGAAAAGIYGAFPHARAMLEMPVCIVCIILSNP